MSVSSPACLVLDLYLIKMAMIEVILSDPAQLFQTADPFPFRENGLEPEAERYFLRRARELKGNEPLRIVLDIGQVRATCAGDGGSGVDLGAKLRSAFAAAADDESRAMGDLFRTGRRFLIIGLCVLATCLLLASQSQRLLGERVIASLVRESAIVFGWVAIWRPAEIFLYNWWPFQSRRAGFRRLSQAEVEVRWKLSA
jgi:hypothetical protein